MQVKAPATGGFIVISPSNLRKWCYQVLLPRLVKWSALVLCCVATPTIADDPLPVDVTTFVRAETDRYLARYAAQGAFGQFLHVRQPIQAEKQDVIRMNRDTLYSIGVFDLTTPVTIRKPDSGGRFQSLLALNQDHYVVGLEHDAGTFTFTKEDVGTRYMIVWIRTFMDPNDPVDLREAHALQDRTAVEHSDPGAFDVPDWDETSLDRTRGLLLALAADYRGSSEGTFGTKEEVDPIKHLVGTAAGWAGNPERAAIYVTVFPDQNDGRISHALTVSDVPVDGFWSLTVYNEDGFMEANETDVYSENNVTAATNQDGSVTVHFGACEDGRVNCIPITSGWNYTVRLYQPRDELLEGRWAFPEARPIE
jgi:hypothetical protein